MMLLGTTFFIAMISILLIGAILIQSPKGSKIDSTLVGGKTTQTLGVARSSNFIQKLTWGLAIALYLLCIISTLSM